MPSSAIGETRIRALQETLRRRRQALREEIEEELRSSDSQQHRELADRIQDGAEESMARLLVDVNLAIVEHHRMELHDIEAALARIGDGIYGTCIACGEPIPPARLESHATATRCLACQAQHEERRA